MEPVLADEEEETETETEIDEEELEDEAEEEEPEIVEVDLDDENGFTTGGGLFDDIDDATGNDGDGDSPAENPLDSLDGRGEALEDAINNGSARLAVVGLEDDDGLEEEFQEVFGAFRLGYFGAEFAQEYVFTNEEDAIDPAWGLLGSMICCTAVVLWMRPDGDEQLSKARNALSAIGGGR